MKAVSSVLSASWRSRNRERGRGIMSGNCGADDMTQRAPPVVPFLAARATLVLGNVQLQTVLEAPYSG